MATTSLKNWKYFENHVQGDLEGGQFVSAATTLIAAGPPRLAMAAGINTKASSANNPSVASLSDGGKNLAFPIGVVENFGLNQNKMVQKMFEIGSKRAYHIPGRTVGALSLGRVLYDGPSLLRVMYAYYPHARMSANKLDNVKGSNGEFNESGATPQVLDPAGFGPAASGSAGVGADQNVNNKDFFINLASDLFDHPLGLMVYIRDNMDKAYGAFYLEDVMLQAHSLNINASSVLIAEGVSAQYDRLVPINITAGQ
ncbi:MAG: hypothetical protein ABFE07_29230 [Armatimonadia bacterium]